MNNKLSIGVGIGVLLIAIGFSFWYVMSQGSTLGKKDVLAIVGDKKITAQEVDEALAQVALQQGFDVADLDAEMKKQITKQVVEMLVDQALIKEKIAEANIVVSDERIDGQIAQVVTQFESQEEFESALLMEGLSMEDFRERVRESIAIEIYLEQELNLSSITATQEDIAELEAQFAQLEDFETMQGEFDFAVYAAEQKQQEAIQQFILQLRESANVEIFI